MKVVILNKSDATGGAAIVSFRLLEALRQEGIDARMLVCEKLTDSPFVELADSSKTIKSKFLLERLKIFIKNGFNRASLFKIDTAEEALSLWKHPLVKGADAVLINWVNQGMLSLSGFKKILQLGKPVIWTMHDMWCLTGICHHAATCLHFTKQCGNCPLLGNLASPNDISHKTWQRKFSIYNNPALNQNLAFVPVSSWLKGKALESSLLKNQKLEVIPNAFPMASESCPPKPESPFPSNITLLFGAARLDDPIKGLDTLRETTKILKNSNPDIASRLQLALFGNIKNPNALEGFQIPVVRLGVLRGEEEIKKAYRNSQILISASSYETLPGTLVEAQAYGCIPVSFNQGGQTDIVENGITGFLALYDDDIKSRASNLAKEILKAVEVISNPELHSAFIERMSKSVVSKFSYPEIARKYIALIKSLSK